MMDVGSGVPSVDRLDGSHGFQLQGRQVGGLQVLSQLCRSLGARDRAAPGPVAIKT